jgi:hypothetical protein
MDRTKSSFRIVFTMEEKEEWKKSLSIMHYINLIKEEVFDEKTFEIPRLYIPKR